MTAAFNAFAWLGWWPVDALAATRLVWLAGWAFLFAIFASATFWALWWRISELERPRVVLSKSRFVPFGDKYKLQFLLEHKGEDEVFIDRTRTVIVFADKTQGTNALVNEKGDGSGNPMAAEMFITSAATVETLGIAQSILIAFAYHVRSGASGKTQIHKRFYKWPSAVHKSNTDGKVTIALELYFCTRKEADDLEVRLREMDIIFP
jgi:hypothetical protein